MHKHSAKLKIRALVLFVMAVLLLSGCEANESSEITSISFNRSHDSVWGNQFYIKINPTEIVTACFIPEGSEDPVTAEHLSITDVQWQTIKSTVEQLPFEKARTDIWKKQKIDGSNFRELTVERSRKEITHYWPNTPEIGQLEQLLEALLSDAYFEK